MIKIILLSLATFIICPSFSQLMKPLRKAERSYRKGKYHLAKKQLFAVYNSGYENNYEVLYFLGATFIHLEDFDSAQIFIDKSMTMPDSKSHSGLYSNKALCQWLTNQDQKAIVSLSKAIEIEPDEGKYYLYRGLIYYFANDFNNSCADLSKAVLLGDRHFPKNAFDAGCESGPDEKVVEIIQNLPYYYAKKKIVINH